MPTIVVLQKNTEEKIVAYMANGFIDVITGFDKILSREDMFPSFTLSLSLFC